ncbi:sulfite exporter TauE/SafE family protein [candidate division KSB1 bacterium]|nr:sulfite exporter TauE/SafE family protein [candidate division KSB1 bacterium]
MNIGIENAILLSFVAFMASTIAAIAGTGGGVILLPVLVMIFGVRAAVPVYTVAQFIGNLSRVVLNLKQIQFKVVAYFSLGAVPCAVLGSWLFTKIQDAALFKILGVFLIASAVGRHFFSSKMKGFKSVWFIPIGAVFAVISGIVGSAGPFLAPFYLSFGLSKGAFIGTEALGTAIMHILKLSSYQGFSVMSGPIWAAGLLLGPIMIGGSYLGKRIVDKMQQAVFIKIVEIAVLLSGIWFILK